MMTNPSSGVGAMASETMQVKQLVENNDDRPVEDAEIDRGSRRWPIFLIIVTELVLCAVLIRKSYFREDDFLDAGVARKYGLSWSLVRYNGFGHLAPLSRLLHLLLINVSSFSYDVAVPVTL